MKKRLRSLCILSICFSCMGHTNAQQENKPTTTNGKTLMAIFAHPDDEIVISPLLSKYAKEGANIYLVLVTDGSKGVTSHAAIPAGDVLAKVRAEEALCVTKTLGIHAPIFLNYTDGDLALNENLYSLDEKIDSLFVKHQPNVVITFGPDGEYGHSDHRMVSNIVTEVFQREASDTLEQLLYYGFPKEAKKKDLTLNTSLVQWLSENLKTTQKRFLTYRISFDKKDLKLGHKASNCHKSQYTPEAIDDLFAMMGQTAGIIYLRPWNGSKILKETIFE
ncbi:PIG-L family deacetylase [Cellulophaga sp. E16_2]|uniref:PIG-L deacetylase family protein n=1 Tax=unclassified Cellulophaga TaxID=2634405 RepID=UPI0013FD91FC|nr:MULTISPECIES: PIG-L family deacetylase [unclassified Cellulophaga]MBO0589872.1 PIG-L family deacetylase [Cellulophaga sp. E16_2]